MKTAEEWLEKAFIAFIIIWCAVIFTHVIQSERFNHGEEESKEVEKEVSAQDSRPYVPESRNQEQKEP